jgi:hypothetical protein
MALTKMQFRLLLVVYCAYLLFILLAHVWTPSSESVPKTRTQVHSDVAQEKTRFGMDTMSDLHFVEFILFLQVTILMAWLIGLVYLFLLWRQGLYFFLIGVCARITFGHVFGHRLFGHRHPSSGGWLAHGRTEFVFELIIVAIGFFGPAKHLFQRGDCPDPQKLKS